MTETRGIEGKLYGEIADAIAARILSGGLRPGDRLPSERDLSQEFHVSRPTVREAMIALEVRGMVRTAERSGVFVTDPAHWKPGQDRPALSRTLATVSTAEILEGMATLLPEVASLAARSVANGEASPMATPNVATGPLALFNQIAEVTGNLAIRNIVGTLIDTAASIGIESLAANSEPAQARARQAIVDAIAAGDPDTAGQATRNMVARLFAMLIDADIFAAQPSATFMNEQRRKLASRHPLAFAP